MTNLEIARQATMRPIADVACDLGLSEEEFEPLGRYKGKLTFEGVAHLRVAKRDSKLILVTAITPTPAGEGKTTTSIGLAQGLCRMGKKAVSATREPALGPVFGVKGGACGGGYSQVLPMEEINLFFNGDFPAIAAAHNLLSAVLDAHIFNKNALGIDPSIPAWPRTVDMNDRALRQITSGQGGKSNGPLRESSFVITPASEIMACLCLSRTLEELKVRLGRIVAGRTGDGTPVTALDLQASGAMAALLRDAIRPNLVQTIEGGPAFVHGGPFGNIAHGCSSIVSTECALGIADYVVTEAGFASDLGAEKFLDIKCPVLERGPDAIVLVATVRALKHHGKGDIREGSQNLFQHLKHLCNYGPPIVIAVNRHLEDSEAEHQVLKELCEAKGAEFVVADPWGGGGAGCEALAHKVVELSGRPSNFHPLYTPAQSFEEKLDTVVKKVYGGYGFTLSDQAEKSLRWAQKNGFGHLPICVAKTQSSLSDDAAKLNAPTGFTVTVRELRVSAGAGFLVAVCGEILLMPGLGKTPAALAIDVDGDGKISGLF